MKNSLSFFNYSLLLCILTGSAFAATNKVGSNQIYCPTVAEMQATMCRTQGAFNTDELKFPRCLILLRGQKFSFGNNHLIWELASLSPSLDSDTPLQFHTAYFDKQGIFCAYHGTYDNIYVRLQYTQSNQNIYPTANSKWELNTPSARLPYKAGQFNRANDYMCITNKNDVTSCPMRFDN